MNIGLHGHVKQESKVIKLNKNKNVKFFLNRMWCNVQGFSLIDYFEIKFLGLQQTDDLSGRMWTYGSGSPRGTF